MSSRRERPRGPPQAAVFKKDSTGTTRFSTRRIRAGTMKRRPRSGVAQLYELFRTWRKRLTLRSDQKIHTPRLLEGRENVHRCFRDLNCSPPLPRLTRRMLRGESGSSESWLALAFHTRCFQFPAGLPDILAFLSFRRFLRPCLCPLRSGRAPRWVYPARDR